MKKAVVVIVSAMVVLWISGSTLGAAQGRGKHGKPSETGVEHAETVANPQGVQHGIEKAESKQASHATKKKAKKHKHHKKATAPATH